MQTITDPAAVDPASLTPLQGRVVGTSLAALGTATFRSPDPPRLRTFYLDLLGAEPLDGAHDPIRAGAVLLAFFASESGGAGPDADEIAFGVDDRGFEDVLARAREMGIPVRGPVEHTPHSRGFYVSDPDGRRVEVIHEDRGIFWRD